MEIFKSEIITSPIPDKPYYKGINTWEYGSFEEAVKFAVIEADKCETESFGVMAVFCDNINDMIQLPCRNTVYKVGEDFIAESQVDSYDPDQVEAIEEILHTIEWTRGLDIEHNYRLLFYYCRKENSDKILDTLNNKDFKSPPQYWRGEYLSCN